MGRAATVALAGSLGMTACLEATPGHGETESAGGSADGATDGETSTSAGDGSADPTATETGTSGTSTSTTDAAGTSAADTSTSGGTMPCAAEVFAGHSYLFCAEGRAWEDAQTFCQGEGASLTTIDDAPEDDWLFATLGTYAAGFWWMGYNDRTMEGTFEWVDGTAPGYENWEASEPNDKGPGEDCGELNRFATGEWNDSRCSSASFFICESR